MAIPSEKKITLSSSMKTFHPNQPQLLSPKKFGKLYGNFHSHKKFCILFGKSTFCPPCKKYTYP